MKKIIVLLALFVATTSFAWTLSWKAPTKYVDGSNIVGKTIYYDAWADGTQFLTKGSMLNATLPNVGSGVAHVYEVSAVVDNVASAKSRFNWTSPLSQPEGPADLQVVP